MQLLPVYTGFIMQAVLGVCTQTSEREYPPEQGKCEINFGMKKESMDQCSSTSQRGLKRQMFCPRGSEECINETLFFTDVNVQCDIEKPSDVTFNVNCFQENDNNPKTCSRTGLQKPANCTLEVDCSANKKRIKISCMTILVPTSQAPETSTSSTTTSATTTGTSSSESTPSTITSATITLTSSSESTTSKAATTYISTDASTIYISSTKMSSTHLTTMTTVGILASSSSEALSQAATATLVGGVVGGVLVGVVITVVVVVVWWKCRRSEIQDETKGESHIYTGLAPVGNSDHGAPTAVPDVIQVSQAGRDTSPLPDFRSERQGETSGQDACSQGDYTYIKEVELEEDGGYSLGKGFPNTVSFKDLAKSGIDSGSGQITDTYNRLGGHAVTSTPQTDTYNRIGGERKDGKIIKDSDEMHASSDYFVLESSPDQEDTYNRLTAGDEPRGQHHNSTYNRIGETDVEHREGMDQELTSPDYLILEKADIPGTQDDYNRPGYVSSETPSSNLKNTYNRIGDISSEEERSVPSPDYFILEKDDGQGN